ncbi:MAG: DUF1223 domain-containing protein [Alphaproteobacteria bacterium]
MQGMAKRCAGMIGMTMAAAMAVGTLVPVRAAEGPVVVELFTSQGCYSCPPAEAYLRELAVRSDLVALEWHVDYWNELVYGAAGKWRDPFSAPEYTQRQMTYGRSLGSGRVYTPQMVIDGRLEAVGSDRNAVERAMERSAQAAAKVPVALERDTAGGLRVGIGTGTGKATVLLVRYLREASTSVAAGENKGKGLHSRNIVTGLRRIGVWDGQPLQMSVPDPNLQAGEGCAVLLQGDAQGPILGAHYCPATGAS